MNIKAIDMQFAIHKNDEAGNKQGQHVQKPMTDQALLAQEAGQTIQRERSQTAKVHTSTGRRINENQEEKEGQERGSRQKRRDSQSESGGKPKDKSKHPYKGHHIDLTL